MDKETTGTVISVATQWWLKINTKSVRKHALDGATFPHIIKVQYTVDGNEYIIRKWIRASDPAPAVGSTVTVCYPEKKPGKGKVQTAQRSQGHLENTQDEEERTYYLPIGMCIGMSVGVAIGTATDNLATYMPIGLSVGMAIGALLDAKNRKTSEEDK